MILDFPGDSEVKHLPANAGDVGLISGSGRSSGGGSGNRLQCSCLDNPMERGAWWATDHEVTKESDETEKATRTNEVLSKKSLDVIFEIIRS